MTAIFKREFRSYFSTPIGYIVLAAFYFFLGLYFSLIYSYGDPGIAQIIVAMSTIAVFTIPVLTMRLMSEDRRQKVDQALLTAPVKLTSIVLGKFLAALAVFALGFAPTVIFEIVIASYVSVNLFSYLYALFGMLLLGGALIAIGMFISSLTESAVISAILTLVINILVLYMSNFASMVKVEWIANILEKAAFINAYQNFGENIFSITDVVYFLSISAAFLFLCVRSLDKRRWA
ncbi:MAG: ABC transporter permease [Clostridia bacterium]|nr:ABC transporter permease [Clostridia bacterium]